MSCLDKSLHCTVYNNLFLGNILKKNHSYPYLNILIFSFFHCVGPLGLCVPLRKTRFPVDWRLLAKDIIANIGVPLDVFVFLLAPYFFLF